MADDYQDIGSGIEIFTQVFDWSTNPSCDLVLTRNLSTQPGTATLLTTLNEYTPISFEASATLVSKEMEFDLLTFINDHYGRLIKFWVPYQRQMFKLTQTATSGSSTLIVEDNSFDLYYQGYERICIRTSDDDILTRQINSASTTGDDLYIGLTTPLDRELTVDGVIEICRFILARFNQDEFKIQAITDGLSEITLSFIELIKDYDEL